MPKKNETVEEKVVTNPSDDFKVAMINLGIKFCNDIQAGRADKPVEMAEAAVKIFEATK
jgi:hypothetical protein